LPILIFYVVHRTQRTLHSCVIPSYGHILVWKCYFSWTRGQPYYAFISFWSCYKELDFIGFEGQLVMTICIGPSSFLEQ